MDVNQMNTVLPVERDDPAYPKVLADYCTQQFLVQEGQVLQVYEELVNFPIGSVVSPHTTCWR